MKRITTKEAAEVLDIPIQSVQVLLRYERLPIGYAVKNPGSSKYHYIIYKELLDNYVNQIKEGALLPGQE